MFVSMIRSGRGGVDSTASGRIVPAFTTKSRYARSGATAAALASVDYRDDAFERRRLYTAWDNLGDERAFMRGVETLERAGIPPSHLMAYMLVGYDKRETWERVLYRFHRMAERGIRPYPMVFGNKRRCLPTGGEQGVEGRTLGQFQRWAVRRLYTVAPFAEYEPASRRQAPAALLPCLRHGC
jgi:hypothetical protein